MKLVSFLIMPLLLLGAPVFAEWGLIHVAPDNSDENYKLAFMHLHGPQQNYAEALKLLSLSAANPDLSKKEMAQANNALGYMYLNGLGVAQDFITAHQYFSSSGDGYAYYNMGVMNLNALGRAKYWRGAMHSFATAIRLGCREANEYPAALSLLH